MKIAYTGWTWLINHKDNYRFEFEQFLKEVSQLGYEAVENFAFIKGYFDGDAAEVKRLLDQYGLEMANLYLHYSDDPEADYQKAEEYADFMVAIGATYMNLQGVMCGMTRPTTAPPTGRRCWATRNCPTKSARCAPRRASSPASIPTPTRRCSPKSRSTCSLQTPTRRCAACAWTPPTRPSPA